MNRTGIAVLFGLLSAICGAQTLTITTDSPLPPAIVGVVYSQTLSASGGTPPYSWRFPLGEPVPFFLTLSPAGVLSAAPKTADAGQSYTLRVQATDATGRTEIKSLTLRVLVAAAPALAITTGSPLPGGTVGIDYSQALAASGGTPPYRWVLLAGELPPGLALDGATGTIAGQPASAGRFVFTVQARDEASGNAVRDFILVVAASGNVIPAGPLPSAGAPVAVAIDSTRHRAYVVQRAYYADVAVNDGALPVDRVTVVEAGRVVTTIGVGKALMGDGQGVAVDSVRGRVYVTNADDGAVSVIDSATDAVIETIPVGWDPKGIAVDSASGQVYVANSGNNSVTVLNAAGAVAGTAALAGGAYAVAVDRSTHRAYVTCFAHPWTVVVLEGTTKRAEVPLPLLSTIKAIAIDPGRRAYVSDHNTGMIAVIDLSGAAPLEINRFQAGDYPDAITVDPATHLLYVANLGTAQVGVFNPDGTKVKTLSVLRGPSALAIDEASRKAYVAATLSDSLSVLDLNSQTIAAPIPLGSLPTGLAWDGFARRLYSANFVADAVSVLDPASRSVVASWPCGAAPWALAVDPVLQRLYTLNSGENALAIAGAADGAIRRKIPLGGVEAGVVAVSAGTHRVYVTSGSVNNNNLTVLDGLASEVVATVRVGERPVGIAIDETSGRIYVASQQGGTISVIDAGSNQVIDTWRAASGNLWGLAVDPELSQVYVTVPPNVIGDFSGLEVLDATSGLSKGAIATGNRAEMPAVNPRTRHVFVTDSADGTLTAIDGVTLRVLATFPVGRGARDLVIDPDSGRVYVGNTFDGTVSIIQDKPDL